MAHPTDTAPETPPVPARSQDQPTTARPTLRGQIAENPLLTLFGTTIVALLLFVLGTTNLRIGDTNDRIDRIEGRIDRIEDRLVSLEDRVIDIDLKLTALIAALNATETVDAAIDGRLRHPAAA